MALLPSNVRVARSVLPILFAIVLCFVLFYAYTIRPVGDVLNLPSIPFLQPKPTDRRPPTTHTPPAFKPTPTFAPPAVTDPFPLLATSTAAPPPIPEYNVPRLNLHAEYGLDRPPPLYIGFTRQWPMLLQAVVSYITAGWPAEGIYVVENTGTHNSNRDGKLSLQNPFFLNHTTLKRLGVNVVQTPVLLTFAQLQNFFLHQAYTGEHPYFFYSHQDTVVFSFEDGPDNIHRPSDGEWHYYDEKDKEEAMNPPSSRQPGYRTIYENCLRDLNQTLERGERWGVRWFQYDHLTLVNLEAMEAIGGYDTMIPYYISDCDFNAKLVMDGWTTRHRRVGILNDISSVMTDLGALYRLPQITPSFVDPNPLTPEREAQIKADQEKAAKEAEEKKAQQEAAPGDAAGETSPPERRNASVSEDPLEYFRILNQLGIDMGLHKYREKDDLRNTWQVAQRGGAGEPFYYDAMGFNKAFEILTEAGKGVYREKWGHRDCDLVSGTALRLEDQWHVEKDWVKG